MKNSCTITFADGCKYTVDGVAYKDTLYLNQEQQVRVHELEKVHGRVIKIIGRIKET